VSRSCDTGDIIGERVLGLPADPRVDRGIRFNQLKK
jgi:hypothetical protein